MVLTDKEIRKLVNESKLIEGFEEEHLQSASYDLSAGFEVHTFHTFDGSRKRVNLAEKDSVDPIYKKTDIGVGCDLLPGQYILVKTKERINMPDNLVAHVRPRTTLTKLGLVLTVQHLNPTFSGYLQIGIFNASPFTMEIFPNIIIGQIVFEQLSSIPTEEKLYKNKKGAKYNNENEFIGSKVYTESEVDSVYKDLLSSLFGDKRG